MVRVLEAAGYACTAASNGTEASSHLAEMKYGVVITDLRMFGGGGVDLVRQIATEHPGTPTIVVTGFVEDGIKESMDRGEIFALLKKPFDVSICVEKVAEAIERRAEQLTELRHLTRNKEVSFESDGPDN